MARKSLADDILEIVSIICFYLPLWAIPIVALVPTVGVHLLLNAIAEPLIAAGIPFPPVIYFVTLGITFLLSSLAGFVGWKQRGRRKALLNETRSLDKLRALSWHQFELLVAESYRKEGYAVTETGGSKPDGGVDLVATSSHGQRLLIQCKHWKSSKVGVKIVREMLGVLAKEQAAKVVIVATGTYTQEAIKFAQGQPIELIDGPSLLKRIGSFDNAHQTTSNAPTTPAIKKLPTQAPTRSGPSTSKLTPLPKKVPVTASCPRCGSPLVQRTAKRGSNSGNTFTGCSAFPTCRYTRN